MIPNCPEFELEYPLKDVNGNVLSDGDSVTVINN